MSDFEDLDVFEKLAMSTFHWHRACGDSNSDQKTTVFGTRAVRELSLLENCFPMQILVNSKMLLANRDNQAVDNLV
jgi:hypothetical protein